MVLCDNVAHFMASSRTDYGAITPTFVCLEQQPANLLRYNS